MFISHVKAIVNHKPAQARNPVCTPKKHAKQRLPQTYLLSPGEWKLTKHPRGIHPRRTHPSSQERPKGRPNGCLCVCAFVLRWLTKLGSQEETNLSRFPILTHAQMNSMRSPLHPPSKVPVSQGGLVALCSRAKRHASPNTGVSHNVVSFCMKPNYLTNTHAFASSHPVSSFF